MAYNTPLIELLKKDFNDPIRQKYNANAEGKKISEVKISGNVIRGYGAFSFINEKTLLKTPERSSSGAMSDIQDIPSFVTPHLKIDFSLLFIDDYRKLMTLIYSQNEHIVSCYDIVEDKIVTNRMYFATEQMPKIYSIARQLQGQTEEVVELLGVRDYTVEMIGTNNSVETINVQYYVNPPSSGLWAGDAFRSKTYYQNQDVYIGEDVYVNGVDNQEYSIPALTFNNKYKFEYWCDNANGVGFKYTNGEIYRLGTDKTLYAIWKASAE